MYRHRFHTGGIPPSLQNISMDCPPDLELLDSSAIELSIGLKPSLSNSSELFKIGVTECGYKIIIRVKCRQVPTLHIEDFSLAYLTWFSLEA